MAMTATARLRHRTFMLGNAPNTRRVVFGGVTAYGPVFDFKEMQDDGSGAQHLQEEIRLTLPAGALALVDDSSPVVVYEDKRITGTSASYKVRKAMPATADGMESNYHLVRIA